MRSWLRRRPAATAPVRPIASLRRGDGRGLVVELHGYGSDEHQLAMLAPIDVGATHVALGGPYRTDPGFAWWLPVAAGDALEFAPRGEVSRAVRSVAEGIIDAQHQLGVGPDATVVFGYSQGATLALSLLAQRPELCVGVVAAAGWLLADETVTTPARPVSVLVSNGTLDPVVGMEDHVLTVDRLVDAGHRVSARRDPVPHVIDRAQVRHIAEFVAGVLGGGARAEPT